LLKKSLKGAVELFFCRHLLEAKNYAMKIAAIGIIINV
jgi:hypothetical protein